MELSFFEIFAECAITFAGFASVYAILEGSTGPRGRLRAWTTVLSGILAFALSLVPLILAQSTLDEGEIWLWSSLSGVIVTTLFTALAWRDHFALDARGYPAQSTYFRTIAMFTSHLAVLLMLANLLAWPWSPGPLLYAVGLVLILSSGLLALLHSFRLPIREVLDQQPSDRTAD